MKGVQAHQAAQFDEARAAYQLILDNSPDHADANHLLGVIAHQLGEHSKAVQFIDRAIKTNNTAAPFHNNMGNAQRALGNLENAADSYSQALTIQPDDTGTLSNLGLALTELGRSEEAIDYYRKALQIDPNILETNMRLGILLDEQGHVDDAIKYFKQAIIIKPDDADIYNFLAIALYKKKQFSEAEASIKMAISINPNEANHHSYLSTIQLEMKNPEGANKSCHMALSLNNQDILAHNNLGVSLVEMDRKEEAENSFRNALNIDPDYIESLSNLGYLLLDIGELDEAIASFQRAITLAPNHSTAAHNYLFALLYIPGLDNSQLFDEYCRLIHPNSPVQENKSAGIFVDSSSSNVGLGHITPKREKRLRIGYVSSDFHNHPVGNNVLPLITNHDQKAFEVFCYANLQRSDEITKKIKSHSNHWRKINGLSDEQVAQKIKDDKIHILILLGGHFDKNRPNIATHRASPIQVSMHGGTTTALEAMDYWMTDALLHPPDTDPNIAEKFTETLCRLPNFYAYPCPENTPAVSALPADKNDFITFASFNKPCKMNDEVLDLWSQVLLAVPQSHLILKFRNFFASPLIKQKIETRFEINGIDPQRINTLSSADNMHDHLANYHQADIALDTFPFAGATTTFQALWMGVPVITLWGNRHASRVGGSILTNLSLSNLVADSKEDYIKVASKLAENPDKINQIRHHLREKLTSSSYCDPLAFSKKMEAAYFEMWNQWSKSQ